MWHAGNCQKRKCPTCCLYQTDYLYSMRIYWITPAHTLCLNKSDSVFHHLWPPLFIWETLNYVTITGWELYVCLHSIVLTCVDSEPSFSGWFWGPELMGFCPCCQHTCSRCGGSLTSHWPHWTDPVKINCLVSTPITNTTQWSVVADWTKHS